MYWTKRHVLICTAVHCNSKGAMDLAGRLRIELIRKKLDAEILVNNCGTIDLCDIGPNVVIYPDNVILRGVTLKDLPVLVEYLRGGPVPEHLLLTPYGGEEEKRRILYREALGLGESLLVDEFNQLATEHGFDGAWVDEQARRGFIARKASAEDGLVHVTVTTKTRNRYQI